MLSKQQKWNQRYAQAELSTPAPAAWVLHQHADLLPLQGKALDIACGLGGNARFLARCGLKTQAWDLSEVAVALLQKWARSQQLSKLSAEVHDIDAALLSEQSFDVITVSRFLDRSLFPALVQALKPNGLLFYQTFLAPVQANAPSRAKLYVKSAELNQAFATSLRCEVFGEGWLNEQGESQRFAWYIGRKV